MKRKILAFAIAYAYTLGFASTGVSAQISQSAQSVLPEASALAAVAGVATVTATKERGGYARVGNAEIVIPPGAVDEAVEITIRLLPATMELNDGLSNVTAGAAGYRFEPKGMIFKRPVEVRIGYNPALESTAGALDDLYTYFYDERVERWEALERVEIDRASSTLVSRTTHFTDMVNATLTLPEGPDSVDFNVNSIKNLEAANPNAGIPEFQGVEANSFGSATFRIPLETPGGRAGMVPEVALAYASDGGSGLVGRGFDLRAGGAITIDTRMRLPTYTLEDTFLLDGEKLEPVVGQLPPPSERSAEIQYQARSNKKFERITRKRAVIDGIETTYWTVTDTSGRRRVYGLGAGWTGPEAAKKYEWKLSREIDAHGNTIDYEYENYTDEKYAYLSRVSYTGYAKGEIAASSDEPGLFSVDLKWTETRMDTRSSARGLFLQRIRRELRSVSMNCAGSAVWSYEFDYAHNENRHLVLRAIKKMVDRKEFWKYGFEYNGAGATPPDEAVIVDGFDDPIDWAIPDHGGRTLSRTGSSGGGASLYLGLKFYVPYVFGRYVIASIGASVGVQTTASGTKMTMLDVDGDGLSDMVWQSDAGVHYARNEGVGAEGAGSFDDSFSGSVLFPLTGKSLNKENQTTYSLSFSESLGPAAANLTEQWSETSAHGTFADVDGDGFVDYLTSDETRFYRNSADGFTEVGWGEMADGVEPSALFRKNKESFDRTYYAQEPYILWRPEYAGTVVVDQRAGLVHPAAASADGVTLDSYHAESDGDSIASSTRFASVLLSRAQDSGEIASEREVTTKSRIFFHVDGGDSCERDDASWSIGIRYRTIRPFEYIGDSSAVLLKNSILTRSPRPDLSALYDSREVAGEQGPTYEYTLKPAWEEILQRDPESARSVYLDDAYTVPRSIGEEAFYALSDQGTESVRLKFYDGRKIAEERLPENRVLLSGYSFEGERARFVRREDDGDVWQFVPESLGSLNGSFERASAAGYIRSHRSNLSDDQKRSLGFVRAPDTGEPVIPYQKDGETLVAGVPLERPLAPRLDATDLAGAVLGDSTYLLDATGSLCRVSGNSLYRSIDGDDAATDATVERLGDILRVTTTSSGVSAVYVLSGKTSALSSVDREIFESRVTPLVQGDASLMALFALVGDSYATREGLSDDERGEVEKLYESAGIARYSSFLTRFVYAMDAEFTVETSQDGSSGIRIPVIRDEIITSRWIDVPTYDSAEDFTSDDSRGIERMMERLGLSSSTDIDDLGDEGGITLAEYARGGRKGWYYGLWSGYYDFDAGKIGAESDKKRDGETSRKPPYSRDIRKNSDADGNPYLTVSAREPSVALGTNALIGDVSVISEPALDADLRTTVTDRAYATFYDGRRIHVERIGGSAYESASNSETGPSQGKPGKLRASASGATDIGVSLSVPGLGGQISENKGTSWQYKGLLDVNGDLFPDMIQFDDDCDAGTQSFSVQAGTGSGFGPKRRYDGRLPAMSEIKNFGHGFGVSLNPGGFASSKNDAQGKQEELIVTVGGCGLIPSIGISGSYGRSVVESQFIDMNGDGLPDQVRRDGVGSFSVALNLGDGTFSDYANWGDGIAREVSNALDVSVKSAGVSTSRNSSIGVPLPVGALVGASISVSSSTNEVVSNLIDINGDGLPDQVYKRNGEGYFVARLNLGDSFDPNETMVRRPDWTDEEAMNQAIVDSVDAGGNALTTSASGSVYDDARDQQSVGKIDVDSMKNHPAARETALLSVKDVMESTSGVTYNVAISLEVIIRYYLLGIFITPGTSLNFGHTTSMMRFTDINGDGLPDHIRHVAGMPRAQVKLNALGKNGLLRSISTPHGASVELEYASAGNTVDMPQHRYVLARVRVKSGLGENGRPLINAGPTSFTTDYSYEGGVYDRIEREFYGFRTVTKRRLGDQGYTTTRYANDRYYCKGMIEEVATFRSKGELAQRTTYSIDAQYPRITREKATRYDNERATEMTTEIEYEYVDADGNDFGTVTRIIDKGDVTTDVDDFESSFEYHRDLTRYIVSPITSMLVTQGGRTVRKRSGSYTSEGRLSSVTSFYDETRGSTATLTWDAYGNLESVTDPGGARVSYEYDSTLNAYPVSVSRTGPGINGSYRSLYTWNIRTGTKTSETDPSGSVMRYEYDDFHRLWKVWTPYDGTVTPAVEYAYYPAREGYPGYAITWNKLTHDPRDDERIETVIVADSLRRILLTAKRGSVLDERGVETAGWNVAGLTRYDEYGRASEFGQNAFSRVEDAHEFARGDGFAELTRLYDNFIRSTRKTYDALDRIEDEFYPGGTSRNYSYGIGRIETPQSNADRLRSASWVSVRDEEGNSTVQYSDARDNLVKVDRYGGAFDPDSPGGALTGATYDYNCMGEMTSARDFEGHPVTVEYDAQGRRTAIESNDSGRREFYYDAAGNVVREVDSALRSVNAAIHYVYDGLNRLVKVDYPFSDDTSISYGAPGAGTDAGRRTRLDDESGPTEYSYGLLGELIRERRTISRLGACVDDIPQEMRYESDYLGRMRSIEYPDGEVVTYSYNRGGLVNGVSGMRLGAQFEYVRSIGYDEFGQRVSIEYGNGVRTSYEYDENRRWLSAVRTTEGTGDADSLYQNIQYGFDGVGNVTFAENDAFLSKTRHDYTYDDLYQLTRAEGVSVARPYSSLYTARYAQDFEFDSIGNLTAKKSASSVTGAASQVNDLTYAFESEYDKERFAHRASRSGDMHYRYDENGNVTLEHRGAIPSDGGVDYHAIERRGESSYGTDYGFGLFEDEGAESTPSESRSFTWNERSLLRSSKDARCYVRYSYGHDGNRAVKYSARGETLYYNSMWQMTDSFGRDIRVSKHIYVGEVRVVTKCGKRGDASVSYESMNQYFYHADHLGSVQLVTNHVGQIYERVEYTPYGESWIEEKAAFPTPFRFTGKEIDGETGLYYYGARYMDPKYSRWLSTDPALGDYVPGAPVSEAARKRNNNLPGLGGLYNPVNFALYHYAGNNPVKYVDPDGREDIPYNVQQKIPSKYLKSYLDQKVAKNSEAFIGTIYLLGGDKPSNEGGKGIDCSENVLLSGERASGVNLKDRTANQIIKDPNLMRNGSGQPGSVNFYDETGDGVYEHATIVIGNGKEIHPSSNQGTINIVDQGFLDQFFDKKVNKEFNWKYIRGR